MYWIVLIAGAILALIYVVVKIRHNQLATSDAVFWFLLALVLIVMALFPTRLSLLKCIGLRITRQLCFSLHARHCYLPPAHCFGGKCEASQRDTVQLTQTIALSRTCDSIEESIARQEEFSD